MSSNFGKRMQEFTNFFSNPSQRYGKRNFRITEKWPAGFKICCSDFRNESDGIFVVGVGFFFFRQISTFQLAIFDGFFKLSFESYCCLELKFKKTFYL